MNSRKDNIPNKCRLISNIKSFKSFIFNNLDSTFKNMLLPSDHHLLFYNLERISYDVSAYLRTNWSNHVLYWALWNQCADRFIDVKKCKTVREWYDHLTWKTFETTFCDFCQVLFWRWSHYSRFYCLKWVENHIHRYTGETTCDAMFYVSHVSKFIPLN